MRIVLLLLVATLLVSCSPQEAQKPQLSMRISVVPAETAAQCGITKAPLEVPLEATAAATLRSNGVDVATEQTNPFLFLQAMVVKLDASCAYRFDVSIQGFSKGDAGGATLGAFNAKATSTTVLCSTGTIRVVRSSRRQGAKFLRDVEDGIKGMSWPKLKYCVRHQGRGTLDGHLYKQKGRCVARWVGRNQEQKCFQAREQRRREEFRNLLSARAGLEETPPHDV
jgi:hypothetical protein